MAYLTLFRIMWSYAGRDRWKIILFVACYVLSHVYTLGTPLVFAAIIDDIQHQPPDLLHRLALWLSAYMVLFALQAGFHRAGRYVEWQLAYTIYRRFLADAYRMITRLPLDWHTDHHSGDTIDRINKSSKALRSFISAQSTYIENFVLLTGPVIALALFSPTIALAAFVTGAVIVAVVRFYDGKIATAYDILNRLEHRMAAALYDYIGNIRTVIILRVGDRTQNEIDKRLAAIQPIGLLTEIRLGGMKWTVVPLLNLSLSLGVIFIYVATRLRRHLPISAGSVSAIYQYLTQLSGAFMNFARIWQQLVNWRIDYDATAPIRAAYAALHPTGTRSQDRKPWSRIEIADLSFTYKDQASGLRDLALSFAAGEKIALVGSSGAGKSTLMALLRGLYAPQNVHLTIDGERHDTLSPLFDLTTLIPQEPEIFENTLRFNINFGMDYDEADMTRAVELARFAEVAARLPQSLDTDVRERGVSLSGGERQRLALARGILSAADSPLILLDEPTSSVDMANESAIYENLFTHFTDRTIIASIHRLHLAARFDRILVMDEGRIVQTGTFDELKQQDGAFKKLWDQAT